MEEDFCGFNVETLSKMVLIGNAKGRKNKNLAKKHEKHSMILCLKK